MEQKDVNQQLRLEIIKLKQGKLKTAQFEGSATAKALQPWGFDSKNDDGIYAITYADDLKQSEESLAKIAEMKREFQESSYIKEYQSIKNKLNSDLASTPDGSNILNPDLNQQGKSPDKGSTM